MNKIKLIYSEEELKKFFELVVPPLQRDEVYFLSLSARNKYLTDEERKEVGLSRTEMFSRTIIRQQDFDYFLRKLRRLECDERGYTTRTNIPIPNKTIVVYFNVNPSSMVKAYNKFITEVNNQIVELISTIGKNHETKYDYLARLDLKLMKFVQNTPSKKHYIDIDFDIDKVKEYKYLVQYVNFLKDNKIEYYIIETNGGYHVLIKRDTITCNFHPLVKDLDYLVKKEIVVNQNAMIPLPGCFCGGFKVKMVDI